MPRPLCTLLYYCTTHNTVVERLCSAVRVGVGFRDVSDFSFFVAYYGVYSKKQLALLQGGRPPFTQKSKWKVQSGAVRTDRGTEARRDSLCYFIAPTMHPVGHRRESTPSLVKCRTKNRACHSRLLCCVTDGSRTSMKVKYIHMYIHIYVRIYTTLEVQHVYSNLLRRQNIASYT